MKKLSLLFFISAYFLNAQQNKVQLDLSTTHDLEITETNGVYDLATTGKDPYIFSLPIENEINPENSQLTFEYFCPTGVDFVEVMFYSGEEIKATKTMRDVGSTEGWVEFKMEVSEAFQNWGEKGDLIRFDFGAAPALKLQVKNIQFRSLTSREKEILAQKEEKKNQEKILENNLRNYLDHDYDNAITNVLVTKDEVIIKGEKSGKEEIFLVEIPVYENLTELDSFQFIKSIETNEKNFKLSLDRNIQRNGFTEDRALSKWALVEKELDRYSLLSHARYADSIVPKHTYEFVKPSTKKGLGGYSAGREAPSSDLEELGITSATVNIWINGIFRSEASEENMPFEYMGRTYYVNKEEVEKYDKTFLSTVAKDIEVSAILLVAKESSSTDKEIGRILQHPDTDPAGIYAMPNVTTTEGVQYYAAILDFLAQRYSRPDKKYGRIHHWIIHNEVDAGWVWTNAGDKEALVFMDLYHKSMRMSYNIARKYNPNSKVFISLTHYWNWTSNPNFYHSKELLEQLLDFSKAEGDFEWAIAQHPYPEDLREPKTWLDEKVSFNFDTKLITFKNTEVLDAWVKQPEVLYKGKKRTVYLSENGTNSPTYSEQDLKEQAAGMAYALKKIKYLDGIDGFQYHNWQDNRKEGGLRIGLRRFPDAEEDPGGKKPVWYVYEAFGTSQEDEVFDQYKEVIGIENWDEIRYKGDIGKKKGQ